MKNKNECMECPIRGACCYLSVELEGYNIILDHQPCEHLDTETGLCKVYEKRAEVPHCKIGENIFNCGSLPKGCLLIKDEKIEHLKVTVKSVANKLTQESLMMYNFMNNNPMAWEIYKKECV